MLTRIHVGLREISASTTIIPTRLFLPGRAGAASVVQAMAPGFEAVVAPEGADAVERLAGAGHLHRLGQRGTRGVAQAGVAGRCRRQHAGAAGIGEVAAEFGGHVDVEHVAGAQHARAGYAVRGLLVDADAGGAGKAVHQPRRRLCAGRSQQPLADRVQFGGGHARLRRGEHRLAHAGDDAAVGAALLGRRGAAAVAVGCDLLAQLHAAGLGVDALVKVTTFLASREHAEANREARQHGLGVHTPALTVIITGIPERLRLIDRIRAARPDIMLTSDFIAGFPGETDQDHADTLKLIEDVGYGTAFSFKYSPRPGTPAAGREEVPDAVADARLQEMQALLGRQQKAAQEAMVGRRLGVLFEKPGRKDGQMIGKSDYLHSVFVEAPDAQIGDLVQVEITHSAPNSLAGRLL